MDTSIDGNPAQTSGDEEENDSGVSEPTPKNKLTKKRPRKATEEAMDRTPPVSTLFLANINKQVLKFQE